MGPEANDRLPHYVPKSEFRIPFNVDANNPRLLEVQLFVSEDQGQSWQKAASAAAEQGGFSFSGRTRRALFLHGPHGGHQLGLKLVRTAMCSAPANSRGSGYSAATGEPSSSRRLAKAKLAWNGRFARKTSTSTACCSSIARQATRNGFRFPWRADGPDSGFIGILAALGETWRFDSGSAIWPKMKA